MRKQFIFLSIWAGTVLASSAAGTPPLPTHVLIKAEHSGWGIRQTNLSLVLGNGVYAAGNYTVAPALVSNLMTTARRPWPQPATNSWPSFTLEPANLGLNAAWVKTNYSRLLEAYFPKTEMRPFPNVSDAQRAWLTNALADTELLGEATREAFRVSWTDDYPSMELRFERDDGQTLEQVFRLNTRAQHPFMLPWQVYDGTNEFSSGNPEISRAVFQILPDGFLNRDRLKGDLFAMVVGGFPKSEKVCDFLGESVLRETLGDQAGRTPHGFELRDPRVFGSSYERFFDRFTTTVHRTNWPERLTYPVQADVYGGVITNLQTILTRVADKVAPLLKQDWLVSRLKDNGELFVWVKEGSLDHPWLRAQMDKVGRAALYDRIQPAFRRALGFTLRESPQRMSEWALQEDGQLLLYGFIGDGVLDWKAEKLGFDGDARLLQSFSLNLVGVFVGPDGKLTEVVRSDRK